MGRFDPCALESGAVQRVYQHCAFCENWRALRLVSKLAFLRIGLDVLIAERLVCALLLSSIVHEIVIAVIRSRSLIALRRFKELGWLFLRGWIEGIEPGRPDVLALSGFASGPFATVDGRVREERLLFEEV